VTREKQRKVRSLYERRVEDKLSKYYKDGLGGEEYVRQTADCLQGAERGNRHASEDTTKRKGSGIVFGGGKKTRGWKGRKEYVM